MIIKFDKISYNFSGISTKSISKPKMQETSTIKIFKCIRGKNVNMHNCSQSEKFKKNVMIEFNKRFGMPFFIPLIALVCSFLLGSRKDKKIYNLNKYIYAFIGISILTLAEITVRYSGISWSYTGIYYSSGWFDKMHGCHGTHVSLLPSTCTPLPNRSGWGL